MKYNFLSLLLFLAATVCRAAQSDVLSLQGDWQVSLSGQVAQGKTQGTISLPGTLCDAGYGTPLTLQPAMTKEVFQHLHAGYSYVGPARYTRKVSIPKNWKNKRIVLTMERVLWTTTVTVNGVKAQTTCESLSAPHEYDLTGLLHSGDNTLEVTVDNSQQHDISVNLMAHAYTNETQTIWNGILGDISLTATDRRRYIDLLTVTPHVESGALHVSTAITGARRGDKVRVQVTAPDGSQLPPMVLPVVDGKAEGDYTLTTVMPWDEFAPNLYTVRAELPSTGESRTARVGMRQLRSEGRQLTINGRPLFLRGTLECSIFPLKGYPPTDVASWRKVFATVKAHGLNHLRFHSWCPPEAAFAAADEMGLYLQIELPLWALKVGQDAATLRFLEDEASRIIRSYGNHPSFCFWAMGNELEGDFQWIDSLMTSLQQRDPRHLYTATAFTFQKGHTGQPEAQDDFWVTQWTDDGWVRGQGVFDTERPSFDKDYRVSITTLDKPLVTHEIGQYSVFPNLDERRKYTSNLHALNFDAVAADMKAKGLDHLATDYLHATGQLAALLYKEDIERALKTPGISGFQLLGLQDFPGQSTALVGLVDAFWDSKGIVSPSEWRAFCDAVVPLARFSRATYWNTDTLRFTLETANYSAQPLTHARMAWRLTGGEGASQTIVAEGQGATATLPIGNSGPVAEGEVALGKVTRPTQLTLTCWIEGTDHKNSWSIWVYPKTGCTANRMACCNSEAKGGEKHCEKACCKTSNVSAKKDTKKNAKSKKYAGNKTKATAKRGTTFDFDSEVVYTRSFDEAEEALAQGKRVLLNPTLNHLKGLEGKFVQVFWSPIHFPNQAGTMGILCDPRHKALAGFPTESHSNWQWWDLCKQGKTMELDSIATGLKPIVRMVDNYYKNRNLGLVAEMRCGNGLLLVCSSDLDTNLASRPEASAMRQSLLRYMEGLDFRPTVEVSFGNVRRALYNAEEIKKEEKSIYD